MKRFIIVNELNTILEKEFDCELCCLESVSCKTKNGFENIRIGFGEMLDLHFELKD